MLEVLVANALASEPGTAIVLGVTCATPSECAAAIEARTQGLCVIVRLPEAVGGSIASECVERMRVALGAADILKHRRADVVVVLGVYEASMTNKSLPSHLAALRVGRGQRVVYVVDARVGDVRRALKRRDFLRLLGQVVLDLSPAPAREEREAPSPVFAEDEAPSILFEDATFAFGVYDECAPVCPLASAERVVDAFLVASIMDRRALDAASRDQLSSEAADLRSVASRALLPGADSVDAKCVVQVLTRCGMHANATRQLSSERARVCTLSAVEGGGGAAASGELSDLMARCVVSQLAPPVGRRRRKAAE